MILGDTQLRIQSNNQPEQIDTWNCFFFFFLVGGVIVFLILTKELLFYMGGLKLCLNPIKLKPNIVRKRVELLVCQTQ